MSSPSYLGSDTHRLSLLEVVPARNARANATCKPSCTPCICSTGNWQEQGRLHRYCMLAIANGALKAGPAASSSLAPVSDVALDACCTPGCVLHCPHTITRSVAVAEGQASGSDGCSSQPLQAPPVAKLMKLCKAQVRVTVSPVLKSPGTLSLGTSLRLLYCQ